MSEYSEFDPLDREIARIYDFLGDEFPYALMKPADMEPEEELRISAAGLGLAAVYGHGEDEAPLFATYIRDPSNPAIVALQHLAAAENHNLIPEGSHAHAIDALILGLPGPLDEYISGQIV